MWWGETPAHLPFFMEGLKMQIEIDNKILTKARRLDIAFHAQRAMQELSFDTFKSVKSIEVELPTTLLMTLPQDYVNYVKLTWSDSNGI